MSTIAWRTEGKVRSGADESATFDVDLNYDVENPYAINVGFHTGASEPVVWTMAVSLFDDLINQYNAPIGEQGAAVTHDPARNEFSLFLRSVEGEATVILPADEVLYFIHKAQPLATDEAKEAARERLVHGFTSYLQGL